ncbi:MAG: hypothetical protein E7474_09130 [Ruminococcaceae bacterium]|nr:hypothetical protein [Oscillospiraceae bacterium]
MSKEPKSHPLRSLFALVFLAAACIGIAELSVARFEDPELYDSVTAPAREAYEDVQRQLEEYNAEREAEQERRRQEEFARELELERAREEERRRELEELAAEEAAQVATAPVIREPLVLADPTITEFLTEGDREILTGGNLSLTYFNQGDAVWASMPFGGDNIGGYGCGPTALAMVVASTTDEAATPESVAAWAAGAGYCAPHSGSALSVVEGAAERYGLEYTALGELDADALYTTLSCGGVIVALMGPGHFTGRGHFILLHGVTLSGGILVADPNSRENSLAVWDPQIIVDELSKSRHDGAPLWLLTQPLAL